LGLNPIGMTGNGRVKRVKWASATKDAVDKFIAAYGGKSVSWDEALTATREDLAKEAR